MHSYIVILNSKNPSKAYIMTKSNFEPYVFLDEYSAGKEARKTGKSFKVVML